jgi:hypothetical protein
LGNSHKKAPATNLLSFMHMNEFMIPTKIIWRRDASKGASECFYPSFYKDIAKRDSFFKENLEVDFVDATPENMRKNFIPIYEKEIVSRSDFKLDRKKISSDLLKKVATPNLYKFMFIYYEKKLVSAVFFSLKDTGLAIGYRATDNDFDKKLSHKATVSYYGEKLLLEYGQKTKVEFFSYGKDTHPFIDKSNIGRPLYKIKTGMRPRGPFKKADILLEKFSKDALLNFGKPILFFDHKNTDGFYQDCYLYYPQETLSDSYLNEFSKVLAWAKINFRPVGY